MEKGQMTSEFIGKNYLNLHMGGAEAQMGFNFVTIYPTVNFGKNVSIGNFVTVEDFCVLGDNVLIGNGAVIRPETHLGNYVKIGHNCILEGDIVIGDHTIIQTQCHITHGARIGSRVMFAPGVIGVNDKYMLHPMIRPSRKMWRSEPFTIEDGVRVGAGAVILAGLTIGKNAYVLPGSVVDGDVYENEIVSGNPAKVVGIVREDDRI